MNSAEFGIGRPVRRKEDLRLVTGAGRYSDDVNLPGQARAVILRSPHAHARIERIEVSNALAMPGVLAVLTGADLQADGLQPMETDNAVFGPVEVQRTFPDVVLLNRDGTATAAYPSPYYALAIDRVRFVGQGVAIVVAESISIAKDAAELIEVDYALLPNVTGTREAAAAGAPALWGSESNVCLDSEIGDKSATEAAFADADHVVCLDTWIQRLTGVPMEPRAAVGSYDASTKRYTLYAGGGGAVRFKNVLAGILKQPPESIRVVSQDVGGNFGTRNQLYPEFALVVWAARRVGRPVKWTCERSESFLSDYQGRDLVSHAELALDREGNFLALRLSNLSNVGAHELSFVPLRKGLSIPTSVYRVPVCYAQGRAVLSNTPSTVPYRSAGRPEAMYLIERLIDLAACEHGFDRIELRRRNMVTPQEQPFTNAVGVTYDNGDYGKAMDAALALGDWSGFAKRRAEARRRGKLRGIGLANYIEITSGMPRERAEIIVHPEGHVEVVIGTLSSGQGHETSFAQCVSDWLGVPFDRVKLTTGDTDRVPVGGGSHSGRSMRFAGVVMGKASDGVIAKAREIAAHLLEAAASDIRFDSGMLVVEGTDRSVGLFEVAKAARALNDLPDHLRGPLAAESDELFRAAGFPYGTQVCEVEIDPETGQIELDRHAAVDDVGRAVNPLILHGQAHGGIAQGVGQALFERCHYDPEAGQLLSGSFMDYAIPRARNLPSFATGISEIPSPSNPLGVRAGGEGGTTPALGAVVNAIVDALAEFGVRHIEMPATPERVWRAISEARARSISGNGASRQ